MFQVLNYELPSGMYTILIPTTNRVQGKMRIYKPIRWDDATEDNTQPLLIESKEKQHRK